MLSRIIGLQVVFALVLGCASKTPKPTATPEGVTEQEYAVYSALLESDAFSFGQRGKSLLIYDHTGLGVHPAGDETAERLRERLPALTPDIISDYEDDLLMVSLKRNQK